MFDRNLNTWATSSCEKWVTIRVSKRAPLPKNIQTILFYENLTILENLNMAANSYKMDDFMRNHSYYNMIEGNTCFKGSGSCNDTDLIRDLGYPSKFLFF